jgi:DNA-binding CsgD family transcriptional regulator
MFVRIMRECTIFDLYGANNMSMHSQFYDVSNELLVMPYNQGIRLARPDKYNESSHLRLSSLLDIPAAIYFIDTESNAVAANQNTASLNSLASIKDIIGKGSEEFWCKEDAFRHMNHDRSVMQRKSMHVLDESGALIDDTKLQVFTFKLPWFFENTVIGVLGVTFKIDAGSLGCFTTSLAQLLATGLIGTSNISLPNKLNANAPLPGLPISGNYFSKREIEIIQYVVQGKTMRKIATKLYLSTRTIENYFSVIKAKVGAESKSHFIEIMMPHFYGKFD